MEGDPAPTTEVGSQFMENTSRGSHLTHPNQCLGQGAGLGMLEARCSSNRFECLD